MPTPILMIIKKVTPEVSTTVHEKHEFDTL